MRLSMERRLVGRSQRQGQRIVPSEKNIVFALSRASRCHACDRKLSPGEIVKLENAKDDREALCRNCAQLTALELVLKGNAKISRLASKYSETSYIVMKWDDTWKCYQRIGILASRESVDRAEKEAGVKLSNRETRAGTPGV